MMYDKLVAWLRSFSELHAHCECYESCGECDEKDICDTFTNKSIITKAGEAADAIEKLEHQVFLADLACKSEAAKAPRWIPVKERLPETYGTRLVATARGAVMVCCYYPQAKNWNTRATVTHWMPLPEPPKEEE